MENYIGIDLNQNLIKAGLSVYPDADLRCVDWMNVGALPEADWCMNIGSLNLRYDGLPDTDDIYFDKTWDTMFHKAKKGIILLLASNVEDPGEGIIMQDPGLLLNEAIAHFGPMGGVVALDHSFSDGVFTIIIYKTND